LSVLLTHARHRATLAATRSLGRSGIDVITSDSTKGAQSFFSKYCKSHFLYPSYKSKPELFINFMRRRIQKDDIDVFMPMGEETFLISKYIEKFNNLTKVPIPDYDTILKANNKGFLLNLADEIGIKTPQTHIINDISDLKNISKSIEFPAVIKPTIGSGAQGIRYIYSIDQLLSEYKNIMEKFGFSELPLIQEFIPGKGYGVAMIFNKGDPRAVCAYKNIRVYPITGGPSTARISIKHTKMEKYAEKLLKELNYHGVAEVEFILDEITKEPVLMEVNPRFWGSLNQVINSGINFPYLLYTMAMEGDIQPVFSYKIGIETRWMLGDCRAMLDYFRTKNRMHILYDFLKLNGKHYDDIDINDPLPTIGELMIPATNFVKTGKFKFNPDDIGR
jgi:predicted ATP-grasp superfamily ATP-dependent carboligase